MTKTAQSVINELSTFQPSDDDVENLCRLYEIFDDFEELPNRQTAMCAIYAFLERYPEAELGNPGPIVHGLESIPGYETSLINSILKQPCDLTVWMVNRILNTTTLSAEKRSAWIKVLKQASTHPLTPESTKEFAHRFLEYQGVHPSA